MDTRDGERTENEGKHDIVKETGYFSPLGERKCGKLKGNYIWKTAGNVAV